MKRTPEQEDRIIDEAFDRFTIGNLFVWIGLIIVAVFVLPFWKLGSYVKARRTSLKN